VPGWLLTAVIGRDLIIIAGALLYYRRVGPFEAEPTIISKLNSGLQLLYILLTLCLLVFAVPGPEFLSSLAWIVLATTAVSGLDYVIRWSARARAARS
jgi:cardiolipin synthase